MADTEEHVTLSTIEGLLRINRPTLPVYALRPGNLKRSASWFLNNFKGKVLYSVKSNPDAQALQCLYDAGIDSFDVASINEVRLISRLFPSASMYFMHPIKSREAIREAYLKYGIKTFSLDSFDELKKIQEATDFAKDLSLHVRISMLDSKAVMNLSSKFGIHPYDSFNLIHATNKVAKTFGICFHVGSQCLDPLEYKKAINMVKNLIQVSRVPVDVIDIGGGFPSIYPNMTPPALSEYMDIINEAISDLRSTLCTSPEIWCEPGRALVAEAGSLLVRVEARKNSMLYLNDGTYGGLFDAGVPNFCYPVRAIRVEGAKSPLFSDQLQPFGFYGPTCDSLDTMKGPFMLPFNIAEGDYIEIGQLGAYSRSIRTNFNGFDENIQVVVADAPLSTMY